MMGRLKAERGTDEGVHWLRDAEGIRSFEPYSSGRTPKGSGLMMVPSSASELGPLSPLAQVDSLRAGCLMMGARQEESELGPLSPLAQVDSR